jgi:hypothetical protein
VECAERRSRALQRGGRVRQIGKEKDKQTKPYTNSVKPLDITSRKAILLNSGKVWQ